MEKRRKSCSGNIGKGLIKGFKYTDWYSLYMANICEKCGRTTMMRVKYEDEMICNSCYDKVNRPQIDNIDIPEKPEIVYLWDHRITLMGTYSDGKERYMITIPKRKRKDFYLDRSYDIKLILKTKEGL